MNLNQVHPRDNNGTIVETGYNKEEQMKNLGFLLLIPLMILFGGCGAIETIFKAGMYWAFFLIILVVALILWIVAKTRRK